MRTVILVGLLAIASAINDDWASKNVVWVYGFLIVFAVAMDFIDFIFKER